MTRMQSSAVLYSSDYSTLRGCLTAQAQKVRSKLMQDGFVVFSSTRVAFHEAIYEPLSKVLYTGLGKPCAATTFRSCIGF